MDKALAERVIERRDQERKLWNMASDIAGPDEERASC